MGESVQEGALGSSHQAAGKLNQAQPLCVSQSLTQILARSFWQKMGANQRMQSSNVAGRACCTDHPSPDEQAPFTDKWTLGGQPAVTSPFGLTVHPKGQRWGNGSSTPQFGGVRPAYTGAGIGPGYFCF